MRLTDAALALACNGGGWHTHYTEAQRNVWRDRVRAVTGRY